MSEADWKYLRQLKPVALNRLCERILLEIGVVCDLGSEFHENFLRVLSQAEEGNSDVAMIFDDLRRSNAIQRLGLMRGHRLITDREFAGFSKPTRDAAARIADSRLFFVRKVERA